jgi:hypothetical protein
VNKEGNLHFGTKVIVCELVDSLYSNLSKEYNDIQVFTWYEKLFDPIISERGPRQFWGDIVIYFLRCPVPIPLESLPKFLIYKKPNIAKIANIEIDGVEGHSSRIERDKNKFRDYCLKKYLKCPVKRIPFVERNKTWLEDQLEKFYFNSIIIK